jgi:hypothetical protein
VVAAAELLVNLSVAQDLLVWSQRLCLLLKEGEEDPWCRREWMLDGGRCLLQGLRRQRSHLPYRNLRPTIRPLLGGREFRGPWVEFVEVLGIGQSLVVDGKMGCLRQLIELLE